MFEVDPVYQPLMRELAIDAEAVFTDPRIHVWRKLSDRENCTLDALLTDYSPIRLHIKRYPTSESKIAEVNGYRLLRDANIPVAPIVAHGQLSDGKSFVILQDLAGYTPADKYLLAKGTFATILASTAAIAAQLHAANLHHRDLYLCHFMVKPEGEKVDVKLIDTARVARLSNPLTRRRWIIKDLGQFFYSTNAHPITDQDRETWLTAYSQHRRISPASLQSSIHRKVAAIARHDANLNRSQPNRNISIPT